MTRVPRPARERDAADAHAAEKRREQHAERDRRRADREAQQLEPDDLVDQRRAAARGEHREQRGVDAPRRGAARRIGRGFGGGRHGAIVSEDVRAARRHKGRGDARGEAAGLLRELSYEKLGLGRAGQTGRFLTARYGSSSTAVSRGTRAARGRTKGGEDESGPYDGACDGFVLRADRARDVGRIRATASAGEAGPARRAVPVGQSAARSQELRRGTGLGREAAARHRAARARSLQEQGFLQGSRLVARSALLALQQPAADRRHAQRRRGLGHERSADRQESAAVGALGRLHEGLAAREHREPV